MAQLPQPRHYKTCILILSLVLIVMVYMSMESVHNFVSDPNVFKFDPINIKDCSDIFQGQAKEDLILPERYRSVRPLLEAELKKHGGPRTGHVGVKPLQVAFLLDVVNASFINTVCETGFNAGHSALLWLTGNDRCKVYSFDFGHYPYSNPMAKFLQKEFPGRLTTIWGDSKRSIPHFTKKNPEVVCDLIFIDGGHNYREVKSDLRNLRAHVNPAFHVLMADDYEADGVKKAWMEELKAGQLKEHFHCKTKKYMGWSFVSGKYINLY